MDWDRDDHEKIDAGLRKWWNSDASNDELPKGLNIIEPIRLAKYLRPFSRPYSLLISAPSESGKEDT